MMSCLTLMPVISSNALASVRDSYSWTVKVSDVTLISIPLKGSAALINHCISFNWSSLDKVEGWNSLSIHFLAAASSARAGAVNAVDPAISATALVIIKTRALVKGPFLRSRRRMLFLRCSDKRELQARVDPGSALIRVRLDRAENHHGKPKRNQRCEPQARNLESLFSDRKRGDGVGADE